MAGPGDYVADSSEGISQVEDLPPARLERSGGRGGWLREAEPFMGD